MILVNDFTCKDCLCSRCEYRGLCIIYCNEEDILGVEKCSSFKTKEAK